MNKHKLGLEPSVRDRDARAGDRLMSEPSIMWSRTTSDDALEDNATDISFRECVTDDLGDWDMNAPRGGAIAHSSPIMAGQDRPPLPPRNHHSFLDPVTRARVHGLHHSSRDVDLFDPLAKPRGVPPPAQQQQEMSWQQQQQQQQRPQRQKQQKQQQRQRNPQRGHLHSVPPPIFPRTGPPRAPAREELTQPLPILPLSASNSLPSLLRNAQLVTSPFLQSNSPVRIPNHFVLPSDGADAIPNHPLLYPSHSPPPPYPPPPIPSRSHSSSSPCFSLTDQVFSLPPESIQTTNLEQAIAFPYPAPTVSRSSPHRLISSSGFAHTPLVPPSPAHTEFKNMSSISSPSPIRRPRSSNRRKCICRIIFLLVLLGLGVASYFVYRYVNQQNQEVTDYCIPCELQSDQLRKFVKLQTNASEQMEWKSLKCCPHPKVGTAESKKVAKENLPIAHVPFHADNNTSPGMVMLLDINSPLSITQNVYVGEKTLGIVKTGLYLVYSSVGYNLHNSGSGMCTGYKTWTHKVVLLRRSAQKEQTILRTEHTCCIDCGEDIHTEHTIGQFELEEGDNLQVRVSEPKLVLDSTSSSFIGLSLLKQYTHMV